MTADRFSFPPVDSAHAGAAPDPVQASIAAMLACQQDTGALIASPDFAQYHFCWLRDSSFAAYAFDRCGEHDASARYHDWVNAALAGIAGQLDAATQRRLAGQSPQPQALPPCRFRLDGTVAADDWPNFQIDGYGTWLWSLREHLSLTGRRDLPAGFRPSVERAATFLTAFSLDPCYDVWAENGDGVHASNLACVYGGLTPAPALLRHPGPLRPAPHRPCHLQRAALGPG